LFRSEIGKLLGDLTTKTKKFSKLYRETHLEQAQTGGYTVQQRAAMTDDAVVVELLVGLKQSQAASAPILRSPPSES
jgi:hypothetical protein